jgi:hypothetical protein
VNPPELEGRERPGRCDEDEGSATAPSWIARSFMVGRRRPVDRRLMFPPTDRRAYWWAASD